MEQVDDTALLREFWYYYLAYYFVYWFVALLLARFLLSLFVQPQSPNEHHSPIHLNTLLRRF